MQPVKGLGNLAQAVLRQRGTPDIMALIIISMPATHEQNRCWGRRVSLRRAGAQAPAPNYLGWFDVPSQIKRVQGNALVRDLGAKPSLT
ncbi:hypothetical protein WCLP8_1870002 [uncultured Gammaproteobacteria bacterium]